MQVHMYFQKRPLQVLGQIAGWVGPKMFILRPERQEGACDMMPSARGAREMVA
jgi:hypothetical protein